MAIDEAGYDEVDEHLEPEHAVFGEHIAQRAAHGIEADIGSCAEGGGEETGDALPEARNLGLRPRHTGEEQQGHGDEDHDEHDVLTIAHETAHRDAEEDAGQQVGHHDEQEVLPVGETGEMEQARHDDGEPRGHEDIDHQIAHGLAHYDAEGTMIVALGGYQVVEAVALTRRSCRQTNAEHQRLLDNEDEHGGQHKGAVAACGTEDGLSVDSQRLGLYLLLALGIMARERNLYLAVHLLRHHQGRLVGCLVGQHQSHVAIDADGGLLHAVEARLEVERDIIEGLGHAAPHEHLRLVDIVGIGYHLDVGRRIAHADKLAAQLGVAVVDHHHGNLAHHLIIIYPRIEQRIDQGHDEEEDDNTLIFQHLAQLVAPDACRVATACEDGGEESFCFHRSCGLGNIYIGEHGVLDLRSYDDGQQHKGQ